MCVCVCALPIVTRTGYGRCAEICSERAPCGERLKWWWSHRRRQRPKWKNYFTNRVCWIYIPCFLILFRFAKNVIVGNILERWGKNGAPPRERGRDIMFEYFIYSFPSVVMLFDYVHMVAVTVRCHLCWQKRLPLQHVARIWHSIQIICKCYSPF